MCTWLDNCVTINLCSHIISYQEKHILRCPLIRYLQVLISAPPKAVSSLIYIFHALLIETHFCASSEPRHDKTNKLNVRPAKNRISMGIHPVWSESSLCAQWVSKDPRFFHAKTQLSHFVGFLMSRLIYFGTGDSPMTKKKKKKKKAASLLSYGFLLP